LQRQALDIDSRFGVIWLYQQPNAIMYQSLNNTIVQNASLCYVVTMLKIEAQLALAPNGSLQGRAKHIPGSDLQAEL